MSDLYVRCLANRPFVCALYAAKLVFTVIFNLDSFVGLDEKMVFSTSTVHPLKSMFRPVGTTVLPNTIIQIFYD